MIQLIAGCKAFHSEFSKTEIEVQDMNSPSSLNQTLISSIHWKWKWVKNTRKQMAHEMMVYTSRISRKLTGAFSVRKEQLFKGKNRAQPLDEGKHRDLRSGLRVSWWIVASSWWPSDRDCRVQMWSHRVKKKLCCFWSLVGS